MRTFEAAGRRLSFSQAAEDLKISQAAVSQQVRQLEDYLNTPLFVRHNRRLSLTGTGQAYFDAVHEALDRLDTVTDQLFPVRQNQVVTLHCSASIATLWLAPELKSFQTFHPEIELRIKTLDQTHHRHASAHSDLQIFIPRDGNIDANAEKLLTSTITPVCSPSLLDKRHRPRRPQDLLQLELIHVLGYDDDWHRWFRQHGIDDAVIPRGLSVDGSLIALEAAQRGDGVMLGRRPFIDRHLRSRELVEVFTEPLHLSTDYYLRQPAKNIARREAKIVVNWLTQLAAQRQS
ncbi:MAG: LysR substrate-binding domain-containing protein [Gammaproteobacteria bacterium]|nr:LysR substrate-binding domain-containing protein [Gammaproteobacteria bacterium]